MNNSKSFILHFMFEDERGNNGQGTTIITQTQYTPITPSVISDALEEVKRMRGWDDTVKIGAIGWQRFESNDEEETLMVEPQENEDVISRQAVREFVEFIQSIKDDHIENKTPINYGTLCDLVIRGQQLLELPSINSQSETGYWIDTGNGQACSKCGEIQYGYDNFRRFCASCGIRMINPQKSEGEECQENISR